MNKHRIVVCAAIGVVVVVGSIWWCVATNVGQYSSAHSAVARRDSAALIKALSRPDGVSDANALRYGEFPPRDRRGPAICLAASRDWVEGIQILHRFGVDLSALDQDGLNAMDRAVMSDSRDAIVALLVNGSPDGRWLQVRPYAISDRDQHLVEVIQCTIGWDGFGLTTPQRELLSASEVGERILRVIEGKRDIAPSRTPGP